MSVPDEAGISWVRLTEAANAAFRGGDFDAARQRWQRAQRLAETEFPARDPRRAAGISNLACASYAAGNYRESERLCRHALAAWRDAEGWLRGMRLQSPARSSTFHLRLRQKHGRRYDRPRLEQYRRLLDAGSAAARNNLGQTLRAAGRPEEARALCDHALAERQEVLRAAGLAADAGAAFYSLAEERRWIVDLPPVLTDEGALMAALLLIQVLEERKP